MSLWRNGSFDDEAWWNMILGIIAVLVVTCLLGWATFGILWSSTHPSPPVSSAEQARRDFVRDCETTDNVPDTQSTPWTCTRPR